MLKFLSGNKKDDTPPRQEADSGPTALGGYGPSAVPQIELNKDNWEKSKNSERWADDPKKRLAIRMFSRGVLGAAFFTAGGLLTKKWMTQEYKDGALVKGYDPAKSFSKQGNPLHFIAKLIDSTAGTAIEGGVGAIAGKEAGARAVRFRETYYAAHGPEYRGRSLGDEVVNITFDFFCASVGDAFGRDIVGWFDPNVKKSWMNDKGQVKAPEALHAAAKALTRYVTYNGGEDWAVAIPYVYFMKAQRSAIDHVSPGFAFDSDRQINGGSFKTRNQKIVGNYNKEGMFDLQTRFTVYNIGTLMYRELYDYAGDLFAGRKAHLYGDPDREYDKGQGILAKLADGVKWMARSTVKALIVMTPSVPFFWINRTPQTKYRGLHIDPELGVMGYYDKEGTCKGVHANSVLPGADTPIHYARYRYNRHPKDLKDHYVRSFGPGDGTHWTVADVDTRLLADPRSPKRNSFNAYEKSFGPVDSVFNAIGKANYRLAGSLDGAAGWVDRHLDRYGGTAAKKMLGIQELGWERFTRPMVYAATAYTPYMYAKAEFSELWDNGKMDLAAERMIDGAFKLNWGEFKAGAGEVKNAVLHRPLDDPKREALAQYRISVDTSAADTSLESGAEKKIRKHGADDWKDRVISGQPEKKSPGKPVNAAPDAYKIASRKPVQPRQASYSEQEEMQEALTKLTPPTNSVH